jgi:DNA-binding MarR family transcriptional regulator
MLISVSTLLLGKRCMSFLKSTNLTLDNFLPYVMNRMAENISAQLSVIYRDHYKLTVAQWRVIANLGQHQSLLAQDIVKFTDMEKTKISRAVNTLVDRGLVVGEQAVGDNRAKNLRLTAQGIDLYQAIVPDVQAWEKDLLSCLSKVEQKELLSSLEKLKVKLEK